ncbi:MAG: histidine kinase [Saprospiraceae bacterium]
MAEVSKNILVSLIFLLCIDIIKSQTLFENYTLLTIEHGLSGHNASDILVDNRGFLWLGSANGLQVYDGNSFFSIPCGIGHNMLKGKNIRCLLKIDSINLLVGTDQGLSKINTRLNIIQNLVFPAELAKALKSNFVQQIQKSKHGYYWVVTMSAIYKVSEDLQLLSRFSFPENYLKTSHTLQPYRICEFPDQSIWVIGPKTKETRSFDEICIFRIDPNHLCINQMDSIPFPDYRRFLSFKQINDSTTFVVYETACDDVNFILLDLKSLTQTKIPHKQFIYNNIIPFICLIDSFQVGITSGTSGEYLIYNMQHKILRTEKLNPSILIKGITQYGKQLFAATDRGLLRNSLVNSIFKPNECTSLFKELSNMPTHVVETNHSIYTSFLYNGISVFNKDSHSCSFYKPISPLNNQTEIKKFFLLDSSHWLISGNASFIYEAASNKSIRISSPKMKPYAFEYLTSKTYKDSKNEFWYGTISGNGIYRYNYSTGKVIHYPLDSIDPFAQFKTFDAITEDRSGNLWFASVIGAGILKWTRKTNHFNIVYAENKPFKYFPSCISEFVTDSNGMIWIGTQGYGVFKMQPDSLTFTDYSDKMDLPDQYIYSLSQDCNGNLWGTCIFGLFTFNPNSMNCYFFNKFHGLMSNNNYKVSTTAGNECKLYLCSNKNLQYIIGEEFKIPEPKPFLYLISVKVNNKELPLLPNYQFEYTENNLELQFAQSNLIDGFLNRYYYRYVGIDTSWTYFGKNPVLHLEGIGYGKYNLQIKVCQNGNACFHKTILQFKVNRSFWKSPWYYAILVLILLGFLLFLIIFDNKLKITKIERERDKEILRNKIAQDIHDEVGSSLTKIALSAQVAARISSLGQEDLKMRLSAVAQDAKIASSQLRELVFSINPDFDHFDDMQAYFQEHASLYLEDAGIQLSFTLPKSSSNELVHPDIKRQLLLIFKEVLNNILKHSRAKQVWISLEEQIQKNYLLEIKDDGIGFNINHAGKSSNGLRGMSQRAESVSATLSLRSSPGSGTSIQVIGPLKLNHSH